jgi:hypothetical protein
MATTKSGFVVTNKAALVGAAVVAAPAVEAMSDEAANVVAQAAAGNPGNTGSVRIDAPSINLATASYAKNAGVYLTLTGTTPITLDFTAIAATTGVVIAGDTAFATWNQIVLMNTGAVDLVMTPGGSNPLRTLLSGTGPGLTIPAGSTITLASVAGLTVDGTHKTLTFTPTSGGSLGLAIGGA